MASAAISPPRIRVDGKFFRRGEAKFYVKGLAYGPFAPNAAGQPFVSPEQTAADFELMRQLGANLVRVYNAPAKWFLDLAAQHQLQVMIDLPWNKHLCFLDSPQDQAGALEMVRNAVLLCGNHPAVFAFSVAHEIPTDIVRWSGARAVAEFVDDLIEEAKRANPECLCTFSNYPPTEFLRPQSVDFHCFSVYLHQQAAFKSYLGRLQMVADSKPLLLGEFGIDSLREGEARKSELLEWQIQEVFRAGLAGGVIFSFTDEWFKDQRLVEDWQMGLTTSQRRAKESFTTVKNNFAAAPRFGLPRVPRVSVVVACYNGERTLKACLDSLVRLNYPDFEIILVDDGSTDATAQIGRKFDLGAPASSPASSARTDRAGEDAGSPRQVRYVRHESNLGLSVARNTGIAAARGEIVAFTDADCRADEDWLYYLVAALLDGDFAGMGGPNLLPPEDSAVAAAVMVSPGGPAHVMLTDQQAEHIPGCNMAFYKSALVQIGGFDPLFRLAGDDVDLCWRLQEAGFKIGFSPAAFVWHYRRSNLGAYLRQQQGYGEAEALLVRKHPEYFNPLGGSLWRGRIYSTAKSRVLVRRPIIYRGPFGSAGFQFLYAAHATFTLMPSTSLEYHVLVTLPLWVLSANFYQLLPLAIASLSLSLGVCLAAGAQAALPKNQTRWWSRPMVAALFFLQPIVRGWARYQGRLTFLPAPPGAAHNLDSIALRQSEQDLEEVRYWAEQPLNRLAFASEVVHRLETQGWRNRADIGWSDYDVEIYGSHWSQLQLTTVAEDHPPRKQMLRCRLRARWSLQAKVVFWLLCGLDLLLLGFIGHRLPWWWRLPLLAPLPVLAWFLHRQQRDLASRIVVFLDALAKEWKLTKVK